MCKLIDQVNVQAIVSEYSFGLNNDFSLYLGLLCKRLFLSINSTGIIFTLKLLFELLYFTKK